MIEPGLIIDAIGQLEEDLEILRAQVELMVRSAKVKRPVFAQLAMSVVSLMPPAFGLREPKLQPPEVRLPKKPRKDLASFEHGWGNLWNRAVPGSLGRFQNALRVRPD